MAKICADYMQAEELRKHGRRQGEGPVSPGGERLRHAGRRRDDVPLQRLRKQSMNSGKNR